MKQILKTLFITFLKIGAITIGGGLVMVPIMKQQLVQKYEMISDEEMLDCITIAQTTPGVIATNTAAAIGYRICGFKGAVVSALGTVIPSFFIMLIVAILFPTISNVAVVIKAMIGLKAGVAALMFGTAIQLSCTALKEKIAIVIFALTLILALFFNISLFILLALGGLSGYIIYTLKSMKR